MEELFHDIASAVAACVEAIMLLVLIIGTAKAVFAIVREITVREGFRAAVRDIWLRYATWIVLALEFALASDLIRTAISPTWDEIGQLAAVAVIRTGLSWFLSRDIEETREMKSAEVKQTT
jgi:uncharacterized membrane protein